jgi:hypothetical protein
VVVYGDPAESIAGQTTENTIKETGVTSGTADGIGVMLLDLGWQF